MRLGLANTIDLFASRWVDISHVESVCLTLGPYRNLTTLTAATLFLHPNCQVLNHARDRIYGNPEVDFLGSYDRKQFDRFIKYAIRISGRGQRGGSGGSITYSHAFDEGHALREIFDGTGMGLTKKKIVCLLWKESLRTSNLIRKRNIDLKELLESDNRLCFLMPIRNPLDCAVSNLRSGHFKLFQGLGKATEVSYIVQAILDEFTWFASLRERFPKRFFYFFEHRITRKVLTDLAQFLKLEPSERWLSNALSAMVLKPGYHHDQETIDQYLDYLKLLEPKFPGLASELRVFADESSQVTIDKRALNKPA